MFSKNERCLYRKNQLSDVICQLRFPEILLINSAQPVELQEVIREYFPHYSVRSETAPPKIVGTPGNFHLESQPATPNYQFFSDDKVWRVNLTSRFISLACSRYESWEQFARHLDKPLAAFIQIYKPSFFQRVGLRYVNFFSRNSLSLEGKTFSQLIQPSYLGPLSEDDVNERTVARCNIDTEISIRGGCRAKIHAGPGIVTKNGQRDQEVKFIFDQDLYMPGNLPVNLTAGALETLHLQAFSIFRGAITDKLHNAMEPQSL